MRKLTANTFVTLDGVMQAPGGPEEDTSGGFKYGGWTFHYFDEIAGKIMDQYIDKPADLLLGRKTYEIFAGYWPNIHSGIVAERFNKAKKYVVSTTLDKASWSESIIIKDNVVEEIQKLKQQDGPEIQVHGSGKLLQTLIEHKLIDSHQICIFPVIVGSGKRLFEEGLNAAGLKLTDVRSTGTGVVVATYEPAGELKTGSFA
jgi:dihydrofolate reductase